MKILSHANQYEIQTLPPNNGIFIDAQISSDGQTWSRPIKFLVDSGATGEVFAVIPKTLNIDLGLELAEVGQTQAKLADGSNSKEPVCQASIRLLAVPSKSPITLIDVPVSLIDCDGATPLLSLAALSFLNLVVQSGELRLLELNTRIIS